jgi:hypothetical protein
MNKPLELVCTCMLLKHVVISYQLQYRIRVRVRVYRIANSIAINQALDSPRPSSAITFGRLQSFRDII